MGSPVCAARCKGLLSVALALSATLIALALALALAAPFPPVGLYNRTPSEPLGWYWRNAGVIRPGAIVAFRPPSAAAAFLGPPRLQSFLKAVAAGPGARVCAAEGILFINGERRAAIVGADRRGRPLPHWSGCLRLGADQWFMLSDRVPNSFDSRYYGPIARGDILGVYAPLSASVRVRRR